MMALDEDMQGFKDDLDSIRSSGSSSSSDGESGSKSKSKSESKDRGTVGRGDMIDLGLDSGDDSEDSPWLANFKKVVYVVVGLAMFQAVVGPIPIPDATLLYVFAFGFLVLGLWAGATKHEELGEAWARVQEWRQ